MLIAMSGLNNLVGGTFGDRESSFMSELDAQIPTAFGILRLLDKMT